MRPKIGIAGGGLVGSLLAWRLLRTGRYDLSIYETRLHDDRHCASYIAAAMLAPYSEAALGDAQILDLGENSVQHWRQWLLELAQDSGIRVEMNARGSIVTAHPSDECDLDQFGAYLKAKASTHTDAWHILDRDALVTLESELTHFNRAIYLSKEASLDNRALLHALHLAIKALGGKWCWGSQIDSVSAHSLRMHNETLDFDWVCDCRGIGAIDECRGLRAVRGEIIRVRAPEVHLSRPIRLLHPRYTLYAVPHPQNIYAIGATEIETDNDGPMTVRSSLELLSALITIHPAFAEAELLESAAALRPAYSNQLPCQVLEPGLLRLNGFYRHGYLLAPHYVELATHVLENTRSLSRVGS